MLSSVDPIDVARFHKEQEKYELEIPSKHVDVPFLKPIPYSASIDRSLLNNLFFMGKFDFIVSEATEVTGLNVVHIKAYI